MAKIISLHQQLIEAKLGRSITSLRLVCQFGQQHVYIFWYEQDGKILYLAARIKGNQEASLGDLALASEKEADAEEMAKYFCETAKDENKYDGDII